MKKIMLRMLVILGLKCTLKIIYGIFWTSLTWIFSSKDKGTKEKQSKKFWPRWQVAVSEKGWVLDTVGYRSPNRLQTWPKFSYFTNEETMVQRGKMITPNVHHQSNTRSIKIGSKLSDLHNLVTKTRAVEKTKKLTFMNTRMTQC